MPCRTRHSRLAAALTALTAWTVAVTAASRTTPPPPYASLVTCLAVLVALAAAIEVRRTNRFEARLAAVLISVLIVAAELLAATLGSPATGAGAWSVEAVVVVAAGCGVPVLVALDARARGRLAVPEHPYAR